MDSVVTDQSDDCFFFQTTNNRLELMYQVVSYERQIWLRRAKPAGQRQKWLQKEFLKQPKQPPKPPQTAPTTLLQLKVYLATLGTNGRSQDWNFSQETPLPPQERTRHLTVAGTSRLFGSLPLRVPSGGGTAGWLMLAFNPSCIPGSL